MNGFHARATLPNRSKILHQLGEPANLPGRKQSLSSFSGSTPGLSPSYSFNTLQSADNVSPLSTPVREVISARPRQFRKQSSAGQLKLSLTGLKEVVSSSPVTTPTHLSGTMPSTTSYFDFPSIDHQTRGTPTAQGMRPSASQHSLNGSAKRSIPMSSGKRSMSGNSLNVMQSPPSSRREQKSAPPGVQTFKIGLPPVEASPRTTLASTAHGGASPLTTTGMDSFPTGLVAGRSDSIPGLESSFDSSRAMTTAKWPSLRSERSSDPSADDGPLEEIVPWLYQDENGKRPGSPSTISSPPRSRQTSIQPPNHRPSVSGMLKGSKSATNMRQNIPRSESVASFEPVPERDRKASGRFMGMLRKKSSAIAVNLSDALHNKDRDRSGSNGTLDEDASRSNSMPLSTKGHRPKLAPRAATGIPEEGSRKRNKKEKKGRENSAPTPVSPAYNGISLDTNLDEMEGIVDLSGVNSTSPYEHLNAVTNNVTSSPRPGTPPSPAQLHTFRRSSLAGSMRNEFFSGDGPDMSPVTKRLGLSRRDSVDIMATMNRWSASGGLTHGSTLQPVAGPSDASRKNSLASLTLADQRRGSEGTVNGMSTIPDSNWIAPDSWAVKPGHAAKEDDSDEEDHHHAEEDTAAMGSLPPTPLMNGDPEGGFGGPATRNNTKLRPGTSGSARGPAGFGQPKLPSHLTAVRIFKPDNAHTILNVPFNITVAELQHIIAKKPGFISANSKLPVKAYKLHLRARGLERMLASQEKPLVWQDRKFRCAGYDPEADRLEELGREDNSYLCKFIFKPETLALFRAEEEGLEGFEYIDLAGRGIENLPIFLYKHAHEIISLNISRNSRLHLPTDFVQLCTSLRDLKMVEMGMKRIPQSVRQVVGLTRLDISINRIVELEHCQLDDNQELTTLYAHNNRLSSLPDYFVRFSALKFLNISNNRFDTFPLVVCELASLNDLDLSFNSLSSLPPEIGKMKSLERLILMCNNISTLPSTMSMLQSLRELDVRRNAIQDFSAISSMPALQTVRAQFNLSKALELKNANLSHLNLGNNALTRFVIPITPGPANLSHLDLSNARLETLPEELFTICINLQLLVLSDNKIRSLSENIANLSKLARLAVNNNALMALPEAIGKLQRLHTLEVSNNKLATIPASIWQCSELTTLNLSSNSIVEFPEPPAPQVDGMDDGDRKASSASAGRLNPFLSVSLKKLYLAYNRLRDDTFRPICLLASLTVLNLSFNDIFEIPPGLLQKCHQLTCLYLSGNMLTSLPADDLERLTNLRILHLNGNKLQTLPAELGSIKSLQVLDVGSNALKYNIANWPYDWNW